MMLQKEMSLQKPTVDIEDSSPNSSLLGPDLNALDVIAGLAQSFKRGMDLVRSVNSGLGMELSRVRDLEKDVLHNVGAERHLEFKLLALINETRQYYEVNSDKINIFKGDKLHTLNKTS